MLSESARIDLHLTNLFYFNEHHMRQRLVMGNWKLNGTK